MSRTEIAPATKTAAPATAAPAQSWAAGADVGEVRDFVELLKPRVMSLVVLSGIAGLLAAPGTLHPVLACVAVLCILAGAGASGAINMWYDRDIDAVMRRTQNRPVVTGRVQPAEALAFGVTLALFSVMLMGLAVNWPAAALLAVAILFYVFVYTVWLKRRTPHNIVIGGAAGAFPPMIGWMAVTGTVDPGAIALFALIFLWTPPHFWALSLYTDIDYSKANVPMLPVVAGRPATKKQMLLYTLALLPLAPAPYLMGFAGLGYGLVALAMGGLFVVSAVRVLKDESRTQKAAKQMFGFSILYLYLLLAVLIVDATAGQLV